MTILGVTGGTLRSLISHYDILNAPIMNATFSVVTASRPDGEPFDVEFRHINGGSYEVIVETDVDDPPGEWLLSVQADNGFRYEEVFDLIGYYRGRRP